MNQPTTAQRRSCIRFQYPTAVIPKHEGKGKDKALFAPPSPAVARHPRSRTKTAAQYDDIFPWEHATSHPPHYSTGQHNAGNHIEDGQTSDQSEYAIKDYFLCTETNKSIEDPPSKQAVSFVTLFSDVEDGEEYSPNDKLMNSDLWLSSSGESAVEPLEFAKKYVPTIKEDAESHRFQSQLGQALGVVKEFEDASSSSSNASETQEQQQQQQSSEQTTDNAQALIEADDLLEELQQALNGDPTVLQPFMDDGTSSEGQPTTLKSHPLTLFKTMTSVYFSRKKETIPVPEHTITPPPQEPLIRRKQTGVHHARAATLPTVPFSTPQQRITAQHFLNVQQQQQPSGVDVPLKHKRGMSADSVLDRPGDVWSVFYAKYPDGMPGVGASVGVGNDTGEYTFSCRAAGDEDVEYHWAQGACW